MCGKAVCGSHNASCGEFAEDDQRVFGKLTVNDQQRVSHGVTPQRPEGQRLGIPTDRNRIINVPTGCRQWRSGVVAVFMQSDHRVGFHPRESELPVGPICRGVDWLITQVESGTWTIPTLTGFYFAKLWYCEALSPVIWTVAASLAGGCLNASKVITVRLSPHIDLNSVLTVGTLVQTDH